MSTGRTQQYHRMLNAKSLFSKQRAYSTCINLTKIPFCEEMYVCVCIDFPSLHLEFPSVLELYRISSVPSTEYTPRLAQHKCSVDVGLQFRHLRSHLRATKAIPHVPPYRINSFRYCLYTARPGSHAEAVADQKSWFSESVCILIVCFWG